MQNNQVLKIKKSFLKLKKKFKKLKNRELKDREEKIKREIEELFHKPITVSKDDQDRLEEQEIKKIRRTKKIGLTG